MDSRKKGVCSHFESGWRSVVFATVLAWSATTALANDFPNKPVRMIVPFAPGGIADTTARLVAQPLSAHWGVQIIIDNRGGAGGNIAAETAAQAPRDGYTVFKLNISNTIAASLYKDKGLKYDVIRDFAPVTQIGASPFILLATPGLNVKSVKELISMARARPGSLAYGSSGIGGSSHLLMEMLKSTAGIELIHIPYANSTTLHGDLIGGRIQVTFATPAASLTHLRSEKLRGLGISSKQRSTVAPDLPTLAESGVPGFEGGTWFGFVVPAKTPAAIVTKLHADVVQTLNRPEVRDRMLAQGIETVASKTPDEFGRFIKFEVDRWARIVAQSGAKAE